MRLERRGLLKWALPAVLLVAVAVAALLMYTRPATKVARSGEVARLVEAVWVQTGRHSPAIPIFAKVTTAHHAQIRAAITAEVKSTVAFGERVRQGEVLVELDDGRARLIKQQRLADVAKAQSQIDAAQLRHQNELFVIRNDKGQRADHNRRQIIKGHEITLAGLRAQLLHAQAALSLAEIDLEKTRVISPFDGQVTQTHVSIGDRVRESDLLVEVFDENALELSGTLAQRYVGPVRQALDNQVLLKATAWPVDQSIERPIEATLIRLGGDVDRQSGGITAVFRLDARHRLPLGRSLKINLQLPQVDNSFVVPNTALYGTQTIYKIVENRLQAVSVKRLGDYVDDGKTPSSLLYSDGIRDGDLVLTSQLPNAITNLAVRTAN